MVECFEVRFEYDGKLHHAPIFKLKAVKIKPISFYEDPVSDWMEMGLSVLKTLDHLNDHLSKYGRPEVGRSSLYCCCLQINPVQTVINPRQQTGRPEWVHVGHCWVTQNMIWLVIPIPLGCKPWDISKPVPDMFNLEKLMPLNVHQIVAYDELHKKAVFGGLREHSARTNKQYPIRRVFLVRLT